ncbi:hypothetical protein LIER_17412 [Lithospermum erythrorhizon]|uniref:Uncharacterized protein n=1 Tax=Lithospermum erythrorhizon TaxID=34254 RepID=A0AAV3QDH4_LITER
METNGSNDENLQGNDGLNLDNLHNWLHNDTPTNILELVHLRNGRTVPERGCPVDVSSVREDGEETYTHTPPVRRGNEHVTGQQSRHEVMIGDVVPLAPPQDTMAALRRQVDALSARVPGQTRKGTNTEFARLSPF